VFKAQIIVGVFAIKLRPPKLSRDGRITNLGNNSPPVARSNKLSATQLLRNDLFSGLTAPMAFQIPRYRSIRAVP